ncbi:MAG TPA: hypothetical protein VMR75_03280 [Candidatus Saccharimonadales bacterium]|nr:hypothetical protein [Candidatus Saccharimonadales bacterium]
MKFKNFDSHKPYFRGVAIATLLCGAVILALGIVELVMNLWGSSTYSAPLFKIIGGLAVTSLGYIQLELEMLRIK